MKSSFPPHAAGLLAGAALASLALSLNACGGSAVPAAASVQSAPPASMTADISTNINVQRMSDLVRELASPRYEGRLPGTAGDTLSRNLVVNEFRALGLQAGGTDGYLQHFNTIIAEPDGDSHGNPANPLLGQRMASSNIIGIIPGNDPVLSKEVIIISAHRDHLGRTPDGIHYPGANDDLSGMAAMLELAHAFTELKQTGQRNKRTLMFVAYGAEEQDEMGSMHHVANPLPGYPNKNIVLMITIDMIGLGFDKWNNFSPAQLNAYADRWYAEVYNGDDDDSDDYSHKYPPDNKRTFSYDAGPFAKIGINNRVFGSTKDIPTYHKTTDTWESLHFKPAAIVTKTIFDFLRKVDQDPRIHVRA